MLRHLGFVVLLLLVSCSPTVEVTQLGEPPAIAPQSVPFQVFTSPSAVGRPYREIALINVRDEWGTDSEGELVQLLIEEAQKLGAHGLLLLGQRTESEGGVYNPVGNSLMYSDIDVKIAQGSAFIYTDTP